MVDVSYEGFSAEYLSPVDVRVLRARLHDLRVFPACRDGGIGRRKGLKLPCPN